MVLTIAYLSVNTDIDYRFERMITHRDFLFFPCNENDNVSILRSLCNIFENCLPENFECILFPVNELNDDIK